MENETKMDRLAPFDLAPFDLLPPAFANARRIRRVCYGWTAVVSVLMTSFGVVAVATTLAAHREHRTREQLVAAAIPLFDLRRDVIDLQDGNTRRRAWCEQVESAKPDDSVFQTIASLAKATQDGTNEITVDRLRVRLPLEYPATAKEVPAWATPQLSVSARITSSEAAMRWTHRLNQCDRIDNAAMNDDRSELGGERVELTAIPLATRVLP